MYKLLSCFSYNKCFYEIFLNEKNKFTVKKVVTNSNKKEINKEDWEIAKKVLDKIADMKYKYFDTITYQNEKLNLYMNLINNKMYISKYDNEKEVACSYKDYKELYDSYNNPIIYNYSIKNMQYIFDDFIFNTSSSVSESNIYEGALFNNNMFKSDSINNSPFGSNGVFGSTEKQNSSFGSNGVFGSTEKQNSSFGSNGVFGSTEKQNTPFGNDFEKKSNANVQPKQINNKPKKNGIKFIKVLVAGVVITALVVSSTVLISKFSDRTAKDDKISEVKIELREDIDKTIESIKYELKDEEQWVVDQVIENYKQELGVSDKQIEDGRDVKMGELSPKTQKLIKSIDSNMNIPEENKEKLKKGLAIFLDNHVEHIQNIEGLCQQFETVEVNYDLQGEGEEGLDLGGQYDRQRNEIIIYKNTDAVWVHEMLHIVGDFGIGITTNKLSEGYLELNNPLRSTNVYPTEQTVVMILEEIYGKEFMEKAFLNGSLYSDIYEKFNITDHAYNEHWNMVKDVNAFLNKSQNYHVSGIKNNPELLSETKQMLDRLKVEYETVTGKKWEDNELLKLCYDRMTGENTSDKHKGYEITDIFIDENGEYKFEIGENVSYKIMEKNEEGYTEITIKNTYVSKDFDVEGR